MQPGFRGRGLLARFFYLLPPSPLGFRDLSSNRPGASIPPAIERAYAAGIAAMLGWPANFADCANSASQGADQEQPHLLRLDPAAYAEWLEFARAVEFGMRPGGDFEALTDHAAKVPGMAACVAGVMHGIEYAHALPWETPIAAGTMGRALEFAACCLRHGTAVMDLMGADSTIAAARKVWDWLERGRRTEATVREAFNALRGTLPRVATMMDALEALEERGYVRVAQAAPAGPGRPRSPSIIVRPDIAETWR